MRLPVLARPDALPVARAQACEFLERLFRLLESMHNTVVALYKDRCVSATGMVAEGQMSVELVLVQIRRQRVSQREPSTVPCLATECDGRAGP